MVKTLSMANQQQKICLRHGFFYTYKAGQKTSKFNDCIWFFYQ